MKKKITGKVKNLDHKIKNLILPDKTVYPVENFFSSVSPLGSVPISLVIFSFMLVYGRIEIAFKLGLGLATTWIIVYSLKKIVDSERPRKDNENLFKKDSFPSGHSANAFLIATVLSTFFKFNLFLFIAASVVALSRVYLNKHNFIDIIVGSLIGVLVALLVTV